jgi:hypothetical protein
MSRRYADPVEVQRHDADPAQFLWRGRLFLVRGVLARWTESGQWWRSAAATRITNGEATAVPVAGAATAGNALAAEPPRARPTWAELTWSGAAASLAAAGEPDPGPAVDDGEREFWRVEAAAGRLAALGVYDLCFDWSRGAWFVVRALD